MSRMPQITAQQLVQFLRRQGFVRWPQTGSHPTLRHEEKKLSATVPIHSGCDLGPVSLFVYFATPDSRSMTLSVCVNRRRRRFMPIITLTTDFGDGSPYVAAMKGVILTINPSATIVDITHSVPAQDITHGAWLWKTRRPGSRRHDPRGGGRSGRRHEPRHSLCPHRRSSTLRRTTACSARLMAGTPPSLVLQSRSANIGCRKSPTHSTAATSWPRWLRG